MIRKNINFRRKFVADRPEYSETITAIQNQLVKQEKIRVMHRKKNDLIVPPMLIISVTNDCNLRCKGCYANSQCRVKNDEMSIEDIDRIIGEGVDMGVSIILLTGGEPLMKKGILDVIKKYDKTVFVMFSNGTLINKEMAARIKPLKNLTVTFSLEGGKKLTDLRRGDGVYDKVMNAMNIFNDENILFGTSITATRQNYSEVTSDEFISALEDKGLGVIFYVEYVPSGGDEDRCLTEKQKKNMFSICRGLKRRHKIFTIPMVGYQKYFGGCLAAGRGLVHISSTGTMEACPFSPWSDTNVKNMPLEDALRSDFIKKVRENHHMLQGANGGCALSENKDWALKMLYEE